MCKSLDLQVETWETLIRLAEADPIHDVLTTDSLGRVAALRERHLMAQPSPRSRWSDRANKDLASLLDVRGRS